MMSYRWSLEASLHTQQGVLVRLQDHNPELHPKWMRLRINGKGRETPVADTGTLQEIAISCLRQSRMSHKQKQRKMREMGLPQEELMRVCVEEETLDPIVTVFGTLNPVKQFCCGRYRSDLYFPRQKVAVECDEGDHKHYNFQAEYKRQRFLEQQLTCRFVIQSALN